MTLRLHLRSVAASNISPQAAPRFQNVAESHLVEQKNVKRTKVAGEPGDLKKHGAKGTHQYEPLHQHTSGRYKIAQATNVATWSAYGIAAHLSHEHDRARFLAVAVPRVAPPFPVSHGRRNRVVRESRSFTTIVANRTPVPKSIPAYMPTKPKASTSRSSDVMRGRGVPSLPQEYREAKAEIDRKIREAESIRLQKLREAKEQEVKRFQQAKELEMKRFQQQVQRAALSVEALNSQMVAVGWSPSLSPRSFVNALLTNARINARLVLVEQRSYEVALVILQDFSNVELDSAAYSLRNVQESLVKAREQRLNARQLRIEEQCRLIAVAVAQERPENATIPTGLSLPELLDKLNANRELRWTRVIETIIQQKDVGQVHYKLGTATVAADDDLWDLVAVATEALEAIVPGSKNSRFLSQMMKAGSISKPFAGLVYALQPLEETYLALEAHNLRSWHRVRLRNELAPEIFAFEARSTLLNTKLAESWDLCCQILNSVMVLGRRNALGRYDLVHERIRNLTDLLKSKAITARFIGWKISGFQFPGGSGAQNADHLHHRELLEAELARVAAPIMTMAHTGELRDTASKIMRSNMYLYNLYNIRDLLADLRRELKSFMAYATVLTRQTHLCIIEVVFWRGMQLQFQSLWGQRSFPNVSPHSRTDVISSVEPEAILSCNSVRDEVGQHPIQQNLHSPAKEESLSAGPKITYVTTFKYACTVLEDFRSSSILGIDILSFPRLSRVPSTSHRSQIQALVLANEEHIAIFHIALFESWDADLLHLPALKEILESKMTLKVGVNMTSHVQHLQNHTIVEMENYVDLNTHLTLHEVAHETGEIGRERVRSGRLSNLITGYYDQLLGLLRHPEDITEAGLIRASYIKYLASGPYAALTVYNMSKWGRSMQESSSAPSFDLHIPGQFEILGRCPRKVTIDPYWREGPMDKSQSYFAPALKVRSKLFSQVARSRELCLSAIVDDLATAFIDDHLRARTKRERIQDKSKLEGRRQDLKAMYLRIYFYERPEDILSGYLPVYSARRVLQLAKQFEINIPPPRKLELEAEVLIDSLDPRERAEMWLESIVNSETSNVRIATPSEIKSKRERLLHVSHRDVLLLYAVWQATSTTDEQIASLFSTTVEQMRSDVLLVHSLNLFHPVKHKLERLRAREQQTSPSIRDNLFPHQPSFIARGRTSLRIEASRLSKAADKLGLSVDPAHPTNLRRRKQAAAATALEQRIRKRDRQKEKWKERKAKRMDNWMDRHLEKTARASEPAEQHGSASPEGPIPATKDTVEADMLTVTMTAEEQALRDASATLQPQPRPQPQSQPQATNDASINSSSKSGGRRRVLFRRCSTNKIWKSSTANAYNAFLQNSRKNS